MPGDFSRQTFLRRKHYSGVLMQQGRVQVDADWNEQQAIQQHRVETEARDVIGQCGAPAENAGFAITVENGDLCIGAGRMYVDGILCENEQPVSYSQQPDFPDPPALSTWSGDGPPSATFGLVYLDVWQREITALDDDHIREKALGGPDTATRLKTVWQVKLLQLPERPVDDKKLGDLDDANKAVEVLLHDLDLACDSQLDTLIAPSTGTLKARSQPVESDTGPCIIPPGAGYRRLENQLYRVEIHQSGRLDQATFKWSRDNGSIATQWIGQSGASNEILQVASTGRDSVLGFGSGQWIELTDDRHELNGEPGTLVQVVTLGDGELTIDPASAKPGSSIDRSKSFQAKPKIRRWDSAGERVVSIPSTNDGWLELEDGVQVQFSDGQYHTGDYWLIPARTATGDVEWPPFAAPNTNPEAQPALGIEHHYCPLAILEFSGGVDGISVKMLEDCRTVFSPLTGGLQVTKVLVKGGYGQDVILNNGMEVPADRLAEGLRVMLNQNVDPATVADATCTVTVEVPFPATDGDRAVWGDATIGYHPVILAGSVRSSTSRTLSWRPIEDTRLRLQRGLPATLRRRSAADFQHDWQVLDPPGSPSNWNYGDDGSVVQNAIGVGGPGFGEEDSLSIGTVSISAQRLGDNAQYLGLTATVGYGGLVGLVFNWISDEDYWMYVSHYYSVSIGFSGGYGAIGVAVAHVAKGQVSIYGTEEYGEENNVAIEISLDIMQTGDTLVFGGRAKLNGRNFRGQDEPTISLNFANSPPRFIKESGVGLVNLGTSAKFTRLAVVYPTGTTTLIPAGGSSRVLAHLALKRNFLRPALSGPYPTYPPQVTCLGTAQADYEQWFWLVPPEQRYGYGSGGQSFDGIGGHLV